MKELRRSRGGELLKRVIIVMTNRIHNLLSRNDICIYYRVLNIKVIGWILYPVMVGKY